jgi:hypothetical protein
MFMVFGGLINLTNRVSSVFWASGPMYDCQLTTVASAPLVMQHSVASFAHSITGIPIHNFNFPGIWSSVEVGG